MFDDTDAINETSVFQPKSMAKFHRTHYLDTKEKPPEHLRAKALLQTQVGFPHECVNDNGSPGVSPAMLTRGVSDCESDTTYFMLKRGWIDEGFIKQVGKVIFTSTLGQERSSGKGWIYINL